MPCAHNCNRWKRQQVHCSAHPENRRRIVDLLEPLRIPRATERQDRCTLLRHLCPFLFGSPARFSVENELRRGGGKHQPFELREGEFEQLSGYTEISDRVKNAFGPEIRCQRESQICEAILVERSFGWMFECTICLLVHQGYLT